MPINHSPPHTSSRARGGDSTNQLPKDSPLLDVEKHLVEPSTKVKTIKKQSSVKRKLEFNTSNRTDLAAQTRDNALIEEARAAAELVAQARDDALAEEDRAVAAERVPQERNDALAEEARVAAELAEQATQAAISPNRRGKQSISLRKRDKMLT